jgi:hypothetical protein
VLQDLFAQILIHMPSANIVLRSVPERWGTAK